jgi:hypothetical protein
MMARETIAMLGILFDTPDQERKRTINGASDVVLARDHQRERD